MKTPLFKPFVWLSGLLFILCEAALELFAVIMKWVSEVKRDACSVSSSLHTSVMTLLSCLSRFLSLAIVCVCAVLVCMLEDSSTIPSFSVTRQQGVASPNRDRFSGANTDPQRKSDCFMCTLKSDIHTALVPWYTIWIKKLTIKSSQLQHLAIFMLYFIIISTALVFSTCYKPLHFYGTNKQSADTTDMHQWVKLKGRWSAFAWLLHTNRRCALCLYNPIKLGRVLGGVWCDNYDWRHQQIQKKNLQVCRFSDGVSRWKFQSHLIYINLFQKKIYGKGHH